MSKFDNLARQLELNPELKILPGAIPSPSQIWQRLDEISCNHTIVLQNLKVVQEEHIRQVKQINNHFAEIERDIKDIRRHIRTENFEQLNNDMLANLNSVRQKIAKLND